MLAGVRPGDVKQEFCNLAFRIDPQPAQFDVGGGGWCAGADRAAKGGCVFGHLLVGGVGEEFAYTIERTWQIAGHRGGADAESVSDNVQGSRLQGPYPPSQDGAVVVAELADQAGYRYFSAYWGRPRGCRW